MKCNKNLLSVLFRVHQCSILLFGFVSFSSLLNSTIIEIDPEGTGDYPTIQAGIDAAAPGDTVWVRPGFYDAALEIDKDLALVSDYDFTDNEEDIHNTILDGDNNNSSVIKAEGEETSDIDVYICGFTIQNGKGWDERGGGVYAKYTDIYLKRNVFRENRAYRGGAIHFKYVSASLTGNTIMNNSAYRLGGGLCVLYSDVSFDENVRNNIYLNYAGQGADIYKFGPFMDVIVDTFTVADPDFYSLYAMEDQFYDETGLSYNILNAKIQQVEQDLYVSATGSDANSGTSPGEPLQNIHYALTLIKADEDNPLTIHVADGLYSYEENNQYFPLHMKSYVSVVGESQENTVLAADNKYGHIQGNDFKEDETIQKNWSFRNFKLTDAFDFSSIYIELNQDVNIENIEITDFSEVYGMRIYRTKINVNDIYMHDCISSPCLSFVSTNEYDVDFTNFKVNNIVPHENQDANSHTFSLQYNSDDPPAYSVDIVNAEITNNISQETEWSHGFSVMNVYFDALVNIVNCTISDNSINVGAAIGISDNSIVNIYNSILFNNQPDEVWLEGTFGAVPELNIYNSLIDGGPYDFVFIGNNDLYWDEATNLDEDPLFINTGDYPFALSEISSCIDAGTLELPQGVVLPDYDLAGNPRVCGTSVDMGAYEWQDTVAPISVVADSASAVLSWSIPPGIFPHSYKIYLNNEHRHTLDNTENEHCFDTLQPGEAYLVGVSAVYTVNEEMIESAVINRTLDYTTVSSSEELIINNYELKNYPNPFNPETTISFALAEEARTADVKVYNIKGQLVKTLMDAQVSPGEFNIIWQGTDNDNRQVASGTYFVKLKVNGIEKSVKKITVLK
jgi:hypothetical protein